MLRNFLRIPEYSERIRNYLVKRKFAMLGAILNFSLLVLSYVSQDSNALDVPPDPPRNLSAQAVSSSEIDLSWTEPSNIGSILLSGYKIERSTDGGSHWTTIVSNTGSAATTYANKGLASGITYTYRVSAITVSLLTSSPSNIASATTFTVPRAPTGLTSTASLSSQINLSWTAPTKNGGSPITNYKIYKSTSSVTKTGYVNVGNVNSYTNTGLTPGVTYFYKVRAVNSAGLSPLSNEASATPPALPSAPQNLQAAVGKSITISWQAPSSDGGSAITGYKVYRSTSSGTETGYVNLGNVTSYTNTIVTPGVTYFYKVRAVNSAGLSPFSNEASATPYSITLVQSGLAGSDSLTNETRTKDQLLANQMYWHYGGSAQVENAPYDIFKDSQGLHIGVQSLANGTNWAGFYGVTPDTSAILFHSVVATSPRTLANQSSFYESGMYF